MRSYDVYALSSAPIAAASAETLSAPRAPAPRNAMCSAKCDTPQPHIAPSWTLPVRTKTRAAADAKRTPRTWKTSIPFPMRARAQSAAPEMPYGGSIFPVSFRTRTGRR